MATVFQASSTGLWTGRPVSRAAMRSRMAACMPAVDHFGSMKWTLGPSAPGTGAREALALVGYQTEALTVDDEAAIAPDEVDDELLRIRLQSGEERAYTVRICDVRS